MVNNHNGQQSQWSTTTMVIHPSHRKQSVSNDSSSCMYTSHHHQKQIQARINSTFKVTPACMYNKTQRVTTNMYNKDVRPPQRMPDDHRLPPRCILAGSWRPAATGDVFHFAQQFVVFNRCKRSVQHGLNQLFQGMFPK